MKYYILRTKTIQSDINPTLHNAMASGHVIEIIACFENAHDAIRYVMTNGGFILEMEYRFDGKKAN